MNKEFIYRELLNILDEESIKVDEPMKKHITFRVGGPADFLVKPKTEAQLSEVIKFAKKENIPVSYTHLMKLSLMKMTKKFIKENS